MPQDVETLRRELEALRSRNRELEQTLDAIRSGEVDAIVVSKGETSRVYALEGADHPYRVLVEKIQEGALTLTATGMILYANAAFAAMRGLPLPAILGTALADHLAPRDRAQFGALLAASRTGAGRGEMSVCTDTASIPVQVSMTPLEVDSDTKISVVITDRRQDYGRLRLQARMLDSVVDAVTAVDSEGTIIYWNEAAERMYGWQASEVVGRPMVDTVDPGVPEELARWVFGQLTAGDMWSGEQMARHREGHSFPVQATKAPVYDEDGTLVAIIGTSHDISERKEAEEAIRESDKRLGVAKDAARLGIYDYDPRTGAIGWDARVQELWGVGPDEPITYDVFMTGIHPEDRAAVQEAVDAALDPAGNREYAAEYRVINREDGAVRWVEATGLVSFEGDRAVRMVGTVRDVTDRKAGEAALRESEEALRQSNEELQRFAYVASHDLQEPLRSIVSFSQLLERRYRGKLGQDADEFIAFIVEGGTRMQSLIRDLLQVSRVETGARPLAPTDAGEGVNGALRLLETSIREAGATVAVGPMPRVMADAAQLEQVFANLISNALKYRREGVPPAIAVSARRLGGMEEFSVADNGIGIEAEYFDRIFQMFQRLHTHDEYEGTGIGLAVVKKIVDRHGGGIRVESTPGEGSTFFFTLPAA